jgi:hypothetical protein
VSGKFLTHLGFHGLNRMRGTCDDDVHVHVLGGYFLPFALSLSLSPSFCSSLFLSFFWSCLGFMV